MREIKFRGQKPNGEWEYGYYVGKDTIIPFGNVNYDLGFIDTSPCYEVIPDTIGQFTGLHDKNGKKIYEGDILLLPANTKVKAYEKGDFVEDKFVQRFAVVWAKQCQGYGLCLPYEAKYDAPDVVGMAAVDRMFVIGNIHDNPELLNE